MIINLFEMVDRYRIVDRDVTVESTRGIPQTSQLQTFIERNKGRRQFDGIYVFGDSLSDIGIAFDATSKAMGEGRPPSPPYFQGRFSNGPVWVEYLALLLGLTSQRNTNFAVGGANTGSMNTFIPENPLNLPGLQQQIDRFTTDIKATYQSANSQALYLVWAGANDYLGGGVTNPTVPIENLSNAVTSLAAVGAKNIVVVDLPDLGKLPATRNNTQQSTLLSQLTQAHNSALATSLNALRQSLCSGTNIILLDVYSLFDRVLSKPTEFGFTNVTDAELDQMTQPQDSNDKFFFWDGIHPTTTVHMILAKSAFSVISPTAVANLDDDFIQVEASFTIAG